MFRRISMILATAVSFTLAIFSVAENVLPLALIHIFVGAVLLSALLADARARADAAIAAMRGSI
jgi:hypothetical protein